MAFTNQSVYLNTGRLEIEGTFDLSAAAAVLNISYPQGQIKTVRGQNMSVVKAAVGTYTVTVKSSSTISGATFQAVELLDGQANLIGATLATAVDAHVGSVTLSATGDIVISINTCNAAGASADTTGAITVSFRVVLCTLRMDQAL
jgi:L-serine deaminase